MNKIIDVKWGVIAMLACAPTLSMGQEFIKIDPAHETQQEHADDIYIALRVDIKGERLTFFAPIECSPLHTKDVFYENQALIVSRSNISVRINVNSILFVDLLNADLGEKCLEVIKTRETRWHTLGKWTPIYVTVADEGIFTRHIHFDEGEDHRRCQEQGVDFSTAEYGLSLNKEKYWLDAINISEDQFIGQHYGLRGKQFATARAYVRAFPIRKLPEEITSYITNDNSMFSMPKEKWDRITRNDPDYAVYPMEFISQEHWRLVDYKKCSIQEVSLGFNRIKMEYHEEQTVDGKFRIYDYTHDTSSHSFEHGGVTYRFSDFYDETRDSVRGIVDREKGLLFYITRPAQAMLDIP